MSRDVFDGLFNKLDVPVIVSELRGDELRVMFLNAAAKMVFAPDNSVSRVVRLENYGLLEDVLRFSNAGFFRAFHNTLRDGGTVHRLDTEVLSYGGETIPTRLYANAATLYGREYYVIYVATRPVHFTGDSLEAFTATVLAACNRITNVEEAIQSVLGMAGDYVKVSRVYIFEEVDALTTRNTYEWCGAGVPPAIQNLQNLKKTDYRYDEIMKSSGMIITNDTRRLPRQDREILEPQGIKAIAIIPLFHFNQPLGYIGFDDCVRHRDWSLEEMHALKIIADVVTTLITRRDAEREIVRSRAVAQTVTDNLDDLVYVSDLETHEMIFVSKSLARAVGAKVEDILGQPCWKILHANQTGPCQFCPVPNLSEREKRGEGGSFVWELHSDLLGKWYLVKDSVVDWVDGNKVHLGTMVDITYRKQYEEQLKHFASIDAMTNIYNRKWGYGKLEELFAAPPEDRKGYTLCFIDLDGLKRVNDTLGHAMGDDMIVNAVRTIFSCVRKDDFICRWGGDEFILGLHCGVLDAEKVMDKIEFSVKHFNLTSGKPYLLSLSHGLVSFDMDLPSLEALIEEADRLMYENKMAKRVARKSEA